MFRMPPTPPARPLADLFGKPPSQSEPNREIYLTARRHEAHLEAQVRVMSCTLCVEDDDASQPFEVTSLGGY